MNRLLFLLNILFLSAATFAQAPTLTAEVNRKTVTQDEELIISYTIRGGKEITKFEIPKNFSFETTNEFQSYKTEYSNNSNPTTTFTKTFTLRPLITGNFEFPKAMAIVDGFTIYSSPIKVNVTKGKGIKNNASAARRVPVSLLSKNEDPTQKIKDNIEIVQSVNKTTCYVGENLLATSKLYARLEAKYKMVNFPTYGGFSIEDQYTSYQMDPTIVQYKGQDYSLNEIRSVHLFPLKPGEYTIDPIQIDANVPLQRETNNHQYENIVQQASLSSNKLNIKVIPLPTENKPSSYTGGVGKYNIQAYIEQDEIFAEELHQLEIIISGEGNLPLIHLPQWNAPNNLVLSQTQIITDYIKTAFPFRGAKKFVIPFYIKEAGSITIPSIPFSYFDPEQKKYIETATEPISLNVLPPTIQNRRNIIEVEDRNYSWLLLIPIALLVGVWFWRKKKKASKHNGITNETAIESKLKRSSLSFEAIKKAYWNNHHQDFYKHLKEYLVDIIEEKDQVKILNQRGLDQYWPNSSFQPYQQEMIKELYMKAQLNRYSQLSTTTELQSDFQKFEKLSQGL